MNINIARTGISTLISYLKNSEIFRKIEENKVQLFFNFRSRYAPGAGVSGKGFLAPGNGKGN